jgi:hypothetical protein
MGSRKNIKKSDSNIVDNESILEFSELVPSEIFEPTMNLRWKRIYSSGNIKELQQLWICRNTGKQEWRAIKIEE